MGKNVIIFEADMSSSVHIHNENKDILILSEGPKASEMKDYALCLGNIKDFTINNMTKKKKKKQN